MKVIFYILQNVLPCSNNCSKSFADILDNKNPKVDRYKNFIYIQESNRGKGRENTIYEGL